MSLLSPEPPQPPRSHWRFVEELQSPLWRPFAWRRRRRRPGEADLSGGVTLDLGFPDERGFLDTAYDDLRRFLEAGGIGPGAYRLAFQQADLGEREAYSLAVASDGCTLSAGDADGIRRAVYYLEDELLRSGGPFLRLGETVRRPVIKTRISRCFFGPIHRPPHNIDELTDDIDYYPDEYLNRLAHEGVNGLWLTIYFAEICRQSVLPEYGQDAARRVAKLRRTVEKCARYGIRIYAFANEPAPIAVDSDVARAHPELLGHGYGDWRYFCTSNPTAQAYLEEAMYNLFTDVPGLGGLINISVGEHGSHCYSGYLAGNNCPRCAPRDPQDVLNDTLAAMERGIHAANPEAELIHWPYGQYILWGDDKTVDSAGRLIPGVTLQHNFESSGEDEQCGRRHKILDYWLSWVGPAQLFADSARAARAQGTPMAAKLQVGCSHEVATAPYVPVPGNLYRKYRAMRDLGVSGAMQCWYFGNYPGLMTKAAGELSFDPLPDDEGDFLRWLARRDWGRHAGTVARAWELFRRGYAHFPLNHVFGWYGPLHDAPTWPLHLEPADLPIAPSWQIAWRQTGRPIAASGDRIGETFTYTHSLNEVRELCGAMARDWRQGAALLKRLLPHYAADEDRRRDIGVAAALALQAESTHNMLRFYSLREQLPYLSRSRQLARLAQMRRLVEREIEVDDELLALARADSRLGFHSEAEGYKYFPAKIEWRREELRRLLGEDFPRVEAQVRAGEPLWPTYTGRQPTGPRYRCLRVAAPPPLDGVPDGPYWRDLATQSMDAQDIEGGGRKSASADASAPGGPRSLEGAADGDSVSATTGRAWWRACHDGQALYLGVHCSGAGAPAPAGGPGRDPFVDEAVALLIEPRRLWPNQRYEVSPGGEQRCVKYPAPDDRRWSVTVKRRDDGWSLTARIPFACLRDDPELERPLRLDVEWRRRQGDTVVTRSWMARHPLPNRLVFGPANPADLGWLVLG